MKLSSPHLESAIETLQIEIDALRYGLRAINQSFTGAIESILERVPPGRVVVTGMGKSGHVGHKIAATLASTGTPAFFVHPAEAGHGDLGMITAADVVLGISQSGRSDELLRLVPYFKRHRIKLIAMTGGASSPLAECADWVIDTAVPGEACPLGLAPTASTTLTMALGDALAICLLKSRGFTADEFASTHPHGSLGRKLWVSVRDVMSRRAESPVVKQHVSVKEALITISSAGLGFVIIVDDIDRPVGVFTDGDLRRCLDRDVDIRRSAISSVMTADFSTVKADQLAVEAVETMERRKVSNLPVISDCGYVIGAVNMRQLLKAGVV